MKARCLKCRFCAWSCPAWWTDRGKHHSGYVRIVAHVEHSHPEEFDQFVSQVVEVEGD